MHKKYPKKNYKVRNRKKYELGRYLKSLIFLKGDANDGKPDA